MNTTQYSSADTSRKPSATVWARFPVRDVLEGVEDGVFFHEDFLVGPVTEPTTEGNFGVWKAFTSTGGAIADAGVVGGAVALSSDGDNEGASLGSDVTAFKISRAARLLCFEVRLKTSTVADTKHGFFAGLIDASALSATVPLAADGTLADENLVGFHRLEGDGDAVDTVYKANGVTAVTVQADAVTLEADTFVKLGMRYEPTGDKDGSYVLSFYKDGTRLSSSKQIPATDGDDFPNDVTLGPVLAVLNATGTTPGSTTIDWVRVGQLI